MSKEENSTEWMEIYKFSDQVKAKLAASVLHSNDIDVRLVNKVDSAWLFLGHVILYVRKEDAGQATVIINDSIRNFSIEEE